MIPRLEVIPERIFTGSRRKMSFALNSTGALWAGFMPLRRHVTNAVGADLFSIEVYPERFFDSFDPTAEFEKWAAVEVAEAASPVDELEMLIVPAGKYAVFTYRGHPANAAGFYQKIFTQWLPENGLELDQRPHFAVMGERYNNDSDDSEEEIWIPVKS